MRGWRMNLVGTRGTASDNIQRSTIQPGMFYGLDIGTAYQSRHKVTVTQLNPYHGRCTASSNRLCRDGR